MKVIQKRSLTQKQHWLEVTKIRRYHSGFVCVYIYIYIYIYIYTHTRCGQKVLSLIQILDLSCPSQLCMSLTSTRN